MLDSKLCIRSYPEGLEVLIKAWNRRADDGERL